MLLEFDTQKPTRHKIWRKSQLITVINNNGFDISSAKMADSWAKHKHQDKACAPANTTCPIIVRVDHLSWKTQQEESEFVLWRRRPGLCHFNIRHFSRLRWSIRNRVGILCLHEQRLFCGFRPWNTKRLPCRLDYRKPFSFRIAKCNSSSTKRLLTRVRGAIKLICDIYARGSGECVLLPFIVAIRREKTSMVTLFSLCERGDEVCAVTSWSENWPRLPVRR